MNVNPATAKISSTPLNFSEAREEEQQPFWLDQKYPLLTDSGFQSRLTERYQLEAATSSAPWSKYQEIRASVITEAYSQMDMLASLAIESSAEGVEARQAVIEIMLDAGFSKVNEIASYCLEKSASVILELASTALPSKMLNCLVTSLTRKISLSEAPKILLLKALEILIKKWRLRTSPPPVKPSQILLEALQLEVLKPINSQSAKVIQVILELMILEPHPSYSQLLDAIAKTHALPEICKQAATNLQVATQSLQFAWDDTREDKLSDKASRAERLRLLQKQPFDRDVYVQTIFNATKNLPIDSTFDERADELRRLLQHESPYVRVAVCWALLGQGEPSELIDYFVEAIETLADIEVNSGQPGLNRDAVQLLDRLKAAVPEILPQVEKAHDRASLKFVERQLQILSIDR
jgi:hypothetical protein